LPALDIPRTWNSLEVSSILSGTERNLADKSLDKRLLIKLFEWTPAFKDKGHKPGRFQRLWISGGIVVIAPFLPEMRDIKLKEIGDKIEDAIVIAAQEGCTVAALVASRP